MEQIIRRIIARLQEKNMTIAAAESCTGGLFSAAITSAAGASAVFEGSVISYSNRIKHELLGVDTQLLQTHGAVSGPCAEAMAKGIRKVTGADIGVSITGIAGPGGGSPQKPVGTVFIGLSCAAFTASRLFHFSGNRNEVRNASVRQALTEVIDHCL